MTIIHPIYQTASKLSVQLRPPPAALKMQAKEFSRLKSDLLRVDGGIDKGGPDLHQELIAIQRRVLSGAALSPQELITYQIKANQFGLKVELVSKVGESAVATIRKLQNPQ